MNVDKSQRVLDPFVLELAVATAEAKDGDCVLGFRRALRKLAPDASTKELEMYEMEILTNTTRRVCYLLCNLETGILVDVPIGSERGMYLLPKEANALNKKMKSYNLEWRKRSIIEEDDANL